MIAPFEDKVGNYGDRSSPKDDRVSTLSDRVRAFNKVDPLAPPVFAGPFNGQRRPVAPAIPNIQVTPIAPNLAPVQVSPNAPAFDVIGVTPQAPQVPQVLAQPNAPQVVGIATEPLAPQAMGVGRDPEPITQTIFVENPGYVFPTTPKDHAFRHIFDPEDRVLIRGKATRLGITIGVYYEVHQVNTTNGSVRIFELDGTPVGWSNRRQTDWEVVEEQDNIGLQHSPASPSIEVEYQPNAPAQIAGDKEVGRPLEITVEASPNSATITETEAYDFLAPFMGPYRYPEDTNTPQDYIAVLDPLAYADDPNIGNYPDGYEHEVLKVDEYLSSTGGVNDLLKTDDGLIGGTETSQIFNLSDQGVTWQYVEFANEPAPEAYSLYRGLERPPSAPASIGVEYQPNAIASLEVVFSPNAVTSVDTARSPAETDAPTLAHSPAAPQTPSIEYSPNAPAIDRIIYSAPEAVASISVEVVTAPQDVADVVVEATPNAVVSVDLVKLVSKPASIEVVHNPNAPAVLEAGTKPRSVASVTAEAAPLAVSSVETDSDPLSPSVVTASAKPLQVASLTVEHSPNPTTAPTVGHSPNAPNAVVLGGVVPASPASVNVLLWVTKPLSITAETTPNAVSIDSVVAIETSPIPPQTIAAGESPGVPSQITVEASPNSTAVPSLEYQPNSPLAPVLATSPNAPSQIGMGGKPNAVNSIYVSHSPSPVSTVTAGTAPLAPTVNSLVVVETTPLSPQSITPSLVGVPNAPLNIEAFYFDTPSQPASITAQVLESAPSQPASIVPSVPETLPLSPSVVTTGVSPMAPDIPEMQISLNEPVYWINKDFIRFSSELLNNGDFAATPALTGWTLLNGAADSDELAAGRLKGDGGSVAITQTFDTPLGGGTYTVSLGRPVGNTGTVQVAVLNSGGSAITLSWTGSNGTNNNQNCTCIDTAEVAVPEGTFIYGLKLSLTHGTRIVESISFFEGIKSVGEVATYAGGGIEKISGGNAWDSGASSKQVIPGNRDGYIQFQVVLGGKSTNVGFTYRDEDFGTFEPYQLSLNGNGAVSAPGMSSTSPDYLLPGDWLRVRHYASSNEVAYQKRQLVDQEQPSVALAIGQKVLIKNDFSRPRVNSSATLNFNTGNYAYVDGISGTGQPLLRKDGTTSQAYLASTFPRGYYWEVIEQVEDYVTFHTDSNPTTGQDLIIDTAFFHVGSRLSDVTIVTL